MIGESTEHEAGTDTAGYANSDIQRTFLTLEERGHQAFLGEGVGTICRGGQGKAAAVDAAIHAGVDIERIVAVLVLQNLQLIQDILLGQSGGGHAVAYHVVVVCNLRHGNLTLVECRYQRIEGGVVLLVHLVCLAEVVQGLAIQVVDLARHFRHRLVLQILHLQLGEFLVLVVQLGLVGLQLLEHVAENGDGGGDQGRQIVVVLIGIEQGIGGYLFDLLTYLFRIGQTIFIVGNTHGQQGADVAQGVDVALHEHGGQLLGGDAIQENVTQQLALKIGDLCIGDALALHRIEIELAEGNLGHEMTLVVGFGEILNRFQINLAPLHILFVALLDHFLIVALLVTAVHLHDGDIRDSILDIGGGLIGQPYADLVGVLVQVLIQKLVVLEIAVLQNLHCLVVILGVDQAELTNILLAVHRENGQDRAYRHGYSQNHRQRAFPCFTHSSVFSLFFFLLPLMYTYTSTPVRIAIPAMVQRMITEPFPSREAGV